MRDPRQKLMPNPTLLQEIFNTNTPKHDHIGHGHSEIRETRDISELPQL